MDLLLEGLQDKAIAEDLGVTLVSVKDHIKRMLRKTGARNRIVLAVSYLRYKMECPERATLQREINLH